MDGLRVARVDAELFARSGQVRPCMRPVRRAHLDDRWPWWSSRIDAIISGSRYWCAWRSRLRRWNCGRAELSVLIINARTIRAISLVSAIVRRRMPWDSGSELLTEDLAHLGW